MKRVNLIEIVPVALCLLFAVAISLYHVSFDGYMGFSEKSWGTVWAIAENGFSLLLCGIVIINTSGLLSQIFKWVFVPYFVLKLIYHISCYSGIYLFSVDTWRDVWSVVLVIFFIVSLIYTLILIRKRNAN
jgi:hypothetical protein